MVHIKIGHEIFDGEGHLDDLSDDFEIPDVNEQI